MNLKKIHRRYYFILFLIILFVISTILALAVLSRLQQSPTIQEQIVTPLVTEDIRGMTTTIDIIPALIPEEQTSHNILLLGHGDQGHPGGYLTDAMLVAHFNTKTNQFALISIPRDIWVKFSTGQMGKLNAAFVKDSSTASIAKSAVQTITGLPIQYYIEVNFYGLTAIVDEFDGIEIDLPHSFEDPWYPIRGREQDPCDKAPEEIAELTNTMSGFRLEQQFECRYETLSFKQGKNEIDGADALKLSRSRHSGDNGSDFSRSIRQQAILLGLKEELLSLDAIDNYPDIFDQLSHTLTTDLNLGILKSLSDLLINISDYTYTSINLSTTNVLSTSTGPAGQFILLPKSQSGWTSVHQFITEQLKQS